MTQRRLWPIAQRRAKEIVVEGKAYTTFVSNDYLGLSQDPLLVQSASAVLSESGMGVSGSRLLGGDTALAHDLERGLASHIGTESALVWASGYQTNLGILASLLGSQDVVFMDREIHASWVDGVRLSGARFFRFRHNDSTHLKALMTQHRATYRKAFVLVESVYSMEGDRCPLAVVQTIAREYDALCIVDEAHAFGVLGCEGFGLASDLSDRKHMLIVGTFGKACGSYGAFVACTSELREHFIQTARSFIYSTGLPMPVLAWNYAAVLHMSAYADKREQLWKNVALFRETVKDMQPMGDSMIVPIAISEPTADQQVADLRESGFWVSAVRYPTIPKGEARLRFSLCADHSQDILYALAEALGHAGL